MKITFAGAAAPPRPAAPSRDTALDEKMAAAIDAALGEADRVLSDPAKFEHLLDPLTVMMANHQPSLPSREVVAAEILRSAAQADAALSDDLRRWLEPTAVHGWEPLWILPTVVRNHVAARAARSAQR